MKVTIPSRPQHEGIYSVDVEISDACPVCGGPRGIPYGGLSYDGSRRLHVSQWDNPCGHIDRYPDVLVEAATFNSNKETRKTNMEVTINIDGTERLLNDGELQEMTAGKDRDFDVTFWPTNDHYEEMALEGQQYTSKTIMNVKKITLSGSVLTILANGRAKLMFTDTVKALYIRAGEACNSVEGIHVLDRKYNNYGPNGQPA
jgi:hypothetical protein